MLARIVVRHRVSPVLAARLDAFDISWQVTAPGGNTFAANIALKWNEAGSIGLSALVASGLVLFAVTLSVNMAARLIIARRAEFSGANG